ncbi:sensor histidine kinase [Lentibacillus jeotgali]|uniref:sensor histidine kinase n=1 Tax=Lentibacillus jeotgali TaxID=558169 RepID=UPI00026267E9|nr:HAMP domain-containing sensor histidine kinase [Lentibacillus jeotgali]
MITGLLICTIGLIPLVLGLSIRAIYKESKLSSVLSIYMVLITIWQFDVGILYFGDVLSEDVILFLFKLLRAGPTFSIIVMFYITYIFLKDRPAMLKTISGPTKVFLKIFNKKVLVFISVWSGIIYIINWTDLGIKGLSLHRSTLTFSHYFPEYGPLAWLYIVHMSSFIVFLLIVSVVAQKIVNQSFKTFLKSFCLHSIIWLIVPGYLNFSSETGAISSSIGVVIFSAAIVHEFIKLNTSMKENYYQLMERQKKLDYTGNLAGSLIHEVKNTNEIIRGFSKSLNKSETMTEQEQGSLEMIQKSSAHLGDLVNNYKVYMKSAEQMMKKEDLESIIGHAIDFSSSMREEHDVEIEFVNLYKQLTVYVNRTNLEQVFINLIKNSIEAMPEERENRKITISTELDNEMILIHFKDTGEGISPENWESVFDPFISFGESGMGMGLPFVKKTIIEHLGDIRVAGSSSRGTHFQIELPLNGALNMT